MLHDQKKTLLKILFYIYNWLRFQSKKILDKAVSIPIFYKMEKNFPLRVKKALEKVI